MAQTIQFTPRFGDGSKSYELVQRLGTDIHPLDRQKKLRSQAHIMFQKGEGGSGLPTLESVQTAVALLMYDDLDEVERQDLFSSALRSAYTLNMHRIERPFTFDAIGFREESMVRCW